MKIDFNDPPDWLNCGCHRCVSLRISLTGSTYIPVCNKCGEILAGKIEGLPAALENCPVCEKEEINVH